MIRRWFLASPALAAAAPASAASPRGIHVLTTAAMTDRWLAMLDRVLSLDYISGLLAYVNWSIFEPRQGEFDWRCFELPLAAAQRHGKAAAFGLMVQRMSPEWVHRAAASFTFEHIHPSIGVISSPVPWDPVYRVALEKTVEALGRRLDGHPALLYMNINGPSSLFGVETNFPVKKISPEEAAKLAYTHEKYAAGWRRGIDGYASAFPRTPLALGLHHELSLGPRDAAVRMETVRGIRDYALACERRSGKRLIVRLLGLGPNNPRYFDAPRREGAGPTDYVKLAWEVRDRAALAYEAARIYSRPNANGMKPLSSEEFAGVLENGISWGAEWIEIKDPDVWSIPDGAPYQPFAGALRDAARRLRA